MILDILASSARFILLKAPTGSGKTVINWCCGKLHGDRFMYLVSTRELQSQLLRDTRDCGMYDLRGHGNYSCAGRDADDEFSCSDKKDCQYRDALKESLFSSSVETNYAHWFVPALEDPYRFGRFACLICDEMHLINDRLCQAVGFSLSEQNLRTLGMSKDFKIDLRKTLSLKDYQEMTGKIRQCLLDFARKERHDEMPRYRKVLKLIHALGRFIKDSDSETEWAVDIESNKNTLIFSPVWCSHYAEKFLYRDIKKIILSSATAKESDLKRIGINPREAEVFEMPSMFDPKRGPIIFISKEPKIGIDNKIDEPRKRMIVNRIDNLLQFHFDRDEKGIIQCTSYEWMNYIVRFSKVANRIISHQKGHSRDGVNRYRKSTIPLALASPSIKEGVDFANEACRFIIVLKIPFLNLHAKPNLMHARVNSDKHYMLDETSRSFEQQIGRGRRNKNDYCAIYVLDAHWLWFKKEVEFGAHIKASFRQSLSPIGLKF